MQAVVDINSLQDQYIPWIEPLKPGEVASYIYLGNENLVSADGKPVVKPYAGISSEHQVINPKTGNPYYLQYIEKWELTGNGDYKPITKHIAIENGVLRVSYKDQNLYKFLEASDENASNVHADQGTMKKFRRLNAQKTAQEQIGKDDLIEKAKSIAKKAPFEKIVQIAEKYKMNPDSFDAYELRHNLMQKAAKSPQDFLDKAKDEKESEIESLMESLLSKSLIKYSNAEWTYKDDTTNKSEVLCKAVPGEDKKETLLKFLKSREGKSAIGILNKIIDK